MDIEVLKFGGSSLASASSMRRVAEVLVARKNCQRVVVCSAMGGVTNELIRIGLHASQQSLTYRSDLDALKVKHFEVCEDLELLSRSKDLESELQEMFTSLFALCEGVFILGELSAKSSDQLVSFGERLAVAIVSSWLEHSGLNVRRIDARDWLVTDEQFMHAQVDIIESSRRLKAWVEQDQAFDLIITEGFIGQSLSGQTTTLGRGGSDYTASLVANALSAICMEKSTDVPGMMTADPRLVPQARIIEEMSYEEAMELCHFGAKVIYHPTIAPLRAQSIPLIVRSTFTNEHPGTRIVANPTHNPMVRGLSSVDGISLITLEGGEIIGRPGFSSRVFSALAQSSVNVILITQSSSENSLTVGVSDIDLPAAQHALTTAFESEMELGRLSALRVDSELSIVALVGSGMVRAKGVSGKAFQSLADAQVNIRAIAQGSTERNISIVIQTVDVAQALRALHRAFFESDAASIQLFCAGVGQVGAAFLKQLDRTKEAFLQESGMRIQLAGIATSKGFAMKPEGIDDNWRDILENQELTGTIEEALAEFSALDSPCKIWVDNSASLEVARQSLPALSQGISVVCSNKIAPAGSLNEWHRMFKSQHPQGAKILNETNVGAALPVIKTIRELRSTGDSVVKLEAILSGSLNFIFSSMDQGMSFAEAVLTARDMGFTEPDPRIDLSGLDVARKVLILARECGHGLEMDHVQVDSFLPDDVSTCSLDDFWKSLDGLSSDLSEQYELVRSQGLKWRFIASLDENGQASCGLKALDNNSPFYSLVGTDNAIAIHTIRYVAKPLVIQGAGAGGELTASGVLADVYNLALNMRKDGNSGSSHE